MQLAVYRTLEDARTCWEALFDTTPDTNAFMTWEYAALWYAQLGKERTVRPHLIVVYGNDLAHPVALLPLMWVTRRHLRWFATPGIDNVVLLRTTPTLSREASTLLFTYIQGLPWAILTLHYLLPDAVQMFTSGLSDLWHNADDQFGSPYILTNGRSWQAYLAGRSLSVRKRVRSTLNRPQRAGISVRYETTSDPDRIELLFPTLAAIQKLRQSTRSGHGPFVGSGGRFFLAVCRTYAARGWLVLHMLWLDERVAAYAVCFTMHNRVLYWRAAYDPIQETYSPGRLLMLYFMQACFESSTAVFDFR